MPPSVDAEIDRLYGLPLADFTRERNALAQRLKRTDQVSAARVKALVKPTHSAWAVNALARTEPEALDALLAAGDRARRAQAKALAGGSADELRDRVHELRETILDLRARAARLLRERGHAAGEDALERVATTLRTASQSPEAAEMVRAGRLTEDLDPLGIAVLASGPRRVAAPAPSPRERERERDGASGSVRGARARMAAEARAARASGTGAARDRTARAERGDRERRQREEQAREEQARRDEEARRAERERRKQAQAALRDARATMKRAEADAARADAAVREAESALDAARDALTAARRERDAARVAVRQARADLARAAADAGESDE